LAFELLPNDGGIRVTRRRKVEGVTSRIQVSLEQVEPRCANLWLDEIAPRAQSDEALIGIDERVRKIERETSDNAAFVPSAEPVVGRVIVRRVFDEKPTQALFDAGRLFGNSPR
jgi:hypothetical protein